MPDLATPGVSLRIAVDADALCIGVLATQVFLDTYAPDGIRPSLAHVVLEHFSTEATTATVADLVRESLSPNTRTAYLSDLAHFENWGGGIPAEPNTVAAYLAEHADVLSVATLNRRLAALAKVHRSLGMANPTSSELVKSVLRGLKRVKGTAQRQAKPLLKDDLILALDATGEGLRV